MPTKLEKKQEELVAKQQKIHELFEAAGEDLDFTKDEVLKLADVKTSKEAVDRVREWTDEMDAVGEEVDELASLTATKERVSKAREANNEPVNQPPIPGGNDRAKKELRSLGATVVGSEAFKSFKATNTPVGCIAEGYSLKQLKTLFQTSAGWAPESVRIPGLLIDEPARPIQILDIIPDGTTTQAAIVYMEETTRTHAAAERAEAAVYAESTFVLTEQTSTVRSIGDSIPVTDEQLDDVPQVESYLDTRLRFGVRQRLDNQVLNGNGTAPNLRGILNATGIQTQARGTDPVPDAVYRAMTLVRVTGRAFPNAYITHPNDWQDVRLLRTNDGIYIWGSPSEAGPERIWGVQVVQSDAIAENTGLVGDFANFCQLFERRGIEVQIGFTGTDFTTGRRTIRAGMRVGFAIYRPAAFSTVTGI